MNQVDIESNFRGLGKFVNNYRPPKPIVDIEPVSTKATNKEPLLELPEQVSTRMKKGNNTLAGVSIDRFESLWSEPQELSHIVIKEQQRGGLDTREYEKMKTK